MGREVRLTTSMGLRLTDPATIMVTAETGETARSRLPARPMGILMGQDVDTRRRGQGHHQGDHSEEQGGTAAAEKDDQGGEGQQNQGQDEAEARPWIPTMASWSAW